MTQLTQLTNEQIDMLSIIFCVDFNPLKMDLHTVLQQHNSNCPSCLKDANIEFDRFINREADKRNFTQSQYIRVYKELSNFLPVDSVYPSHELSYVKAFLYCAFEYSLTLTKSNLEPLTL
jgi:hypothetical protein